MTTLGGLAVDESFEARRACSRDAWPRVRKLEQAGLDPPVCAGVVRPSSAEAVASVLREATVCRVPVLPVGLRSGIVGGLSCRGDEVAIDMSGLDRIISIDDRSLVARAEAGVRGSMLEDALQSQRLTIGHYPQSLHLSSIGGWIATGSSGIASTGYGSIEHRLLGIRVALADGTLVETPTWPRASVGPDLTQLFIGSEGVFGVICDATLAVRQAPATRRFAAWAFPSLDSGLEAMRTAIQGGVRPAVARLYNRAEAGRFSSMPVGALLVLVHEGVADALAVEARLMSEHCRSQDGCPLGEEVARTWWDGRFDASTLLSYSDRSGAVADAIDFVADWRTLGPLIAQIEIELQPLATNVHAHVSHFYETGASVYVVFFLDTAGPIDAIYLYDQVWTIAMERCLAAGAGIAHHHGIGAMRMPWLNAALGSTTELLDRVRRGVTLDSTIGRGSIETRPDQITSPLPTHTQTRADATTSLRKVQLPFGQGTRRHGDQPPMSP